jgi:hypothetical protein
MDILTLAEQVLVDVGFVTSRIEVGERVGLAFENQTVLGFAFAYDKPGDLLMNWATDANRVIAAHQFGLRRAGSKAWNAYIVLLSAGFPDQALSARIGAIEEDLVGTRKIASAGISGAPDVRRALLPLLPIQTAPKIEAANIPDEILLRTTQLPSRAAEAFLSSADTSVVLQVMEE